jgi:hypothetical protein
MKKWLAIGLVIALVANIITMALGKNHWIVFWLVIVIAAVVAYRVLPRL